MRRTFFVAVAISVCCSVKVHAQIPERVQQILIAAQLPVSAAQARKEGVPNGELNAVLEAMRNANVRAHDAREVIDAERTARREHGPVDNFGAFVQSKLQAGLRGRDLAAAIRAEHVARGKGGSRASQPQGAKGRSGAAPAGRATGQKAGSSGAKGTPTKGTPATKTKAATQKASPATDKKRPDTKRRPD